MKTILLRNTFDHLKVKEAMESKEHQVAVVFDSVSTENVNVMGSMNVIQDYLHIYGYKVVEYGKLNTDDKVMGYLYERVED